MDKRLFIIEAMVLFQNKRLQGNLKTLHPITCNIDKHKDCAGLGVGSALTPRLNPTLHQTPTLCSFCPFFQNDASKSVKKQPCRAYFEEKLANHIFILYLCTRKGVTL